MSIDYAESTGLYQKIIEWLNDNFYNYHTLEEHTFVFHLYEESEEVAIEYELEFDRLNGVYWRNKDTKKGMRYHTHDYVIADECGTQIFLLDVMVTDMLNDVYDDNYPQLGVCKEDSPEVELPFS